MKKVITLIVACASICFGAAAQKGSCGDQVKWTLSGETLTISGIGEMTNYSAETRPSWFPYDSEIKHVVVEEGVTSIGDYSFYENSVLETLIVGEGVKSIGISAFQNCTSLSDVKLPNSLESFEGFYSTYYPHQSPGYSFSGCKALTEITIPVSLRKLGYRTFRDCTNLRTVNWNAKENELNSYHYEIFSGCPVHKVSFGATVTMVPEYLFYGVPSLTEIETSGTIEYVGQEAFYGTAWYNMPRDTDKIVIDKALYEYEIPNGKAARVEVPEGLTGITENAFKASKYLVKVTIPSTMKLIGATAFADCTSLGSVQWNAIDCDKRGNGTWFGNCSIYEFNFAPEVKYLNGGIMDSCSDLTEVTLPDSLVNVGPNSFKSCTGLKYVAIPDKVESIEWDVFTNCQMDSIYIGESVKWIGSFLPAKKIIWNVRDLEWGKAQLDGSIFYKNLLEEVTIGDKAVNIPGCLFQHCENLNKLEIGKSVKKIGDGAFQYTGLTEVWFPEGIEDLGYDSFGNTEIHDVLIPASVKDHSCFRHNTLNNVVILGDELLSSWDIAINSNTNVYAKNFARYNSDWGWKSRTQLKPLFTEGETPHYIYNGTSFDLKSNYHVDCNLPGYEIEYDAIPTEITPGKHTADVVLNFKGLRDFSVVQAVKYVISDSEELAAARSNLGELLNSTENLMSIITENSGGWQTMALKEGDMYSNAKCQVEGSDQFTSWSVLFDSESDDEDNYWTNGDATQFHSDYSGEDSSDGLDHYIGMHIPDGINTGKIRFMYCTRWSGTLHTPTSLTLFASTDGEKWDRLAIVEDGLPTEAKATYVSEEIPTYSNYNEFRVMVHSSSSGQIFGGHAIFVMTKFGLEYEPSRDTLVDGISEFGEIDVELVHSVMGQAYATMINPSSEPDDIYAQIDALSKMYDHLTEIVDSYTSMNEIVADSESEYYIYNLIGVKIKEIQHPGIYIVNGKKTVIR